MEIPKDVRVDIDSYRSKSLVNMNDDMVRVVLHLNKKKHMKLINQFFNIQENNGL